MATINPVAASSMIGFGEPPSDKADFSIIDFHGKKDDTIPYDEAGSFGIGPHDSLISFDGFYYDDKIRLLEKWAEKLWCFEEVRMPFYATPVREIKKMAPKGNRIFVSPTASSLRATKQ